MLIFVLSTLKEYSKKKKKNEHVLVTDITPRSSHYGNTQV